MNSYEFGYVLDEFGFLGMARTLCLVYLGVTRIPTKYPYYNINRGDMRRREAPSASGAPTVVFMDMGSRILPRICV